MTQTVTDAVLAERTRTGVIVITLNRPESLNAISPELAEGLIEELVRAEEDRTAGCVVLTGAGRGFCAGGDVKAMARRDLRSDSEPAPAPSPEADVFGAGARHLQRWHREIVLRLYRMPKPVIAVINGAAAGAGIGMAGACDLRVASDRAIFTTAFARIGRSGDFGTSFFVRQLVGPAKARELYFTSDRFDAETALRLGLVNYVYPPDELMARGMELAERIAAGPVNAYARMKQALRAADAGDLERVLEIESVNMPLSGLTAEGKEFLQRFLERR